MKSKRAAKRKPGKSPGVGTEDGFPEDVNLDSLANVISNYYEDENSSVRETEVASISKKARTVSKSPGGLLPFGHGSPRGPYSGDPNHWGQHESRYQSELHQHQLSSSYGNPYKPQQGSYKLQPSAEEHLHSLPPTGSTMGSSEQGPSSSYFQSHQPPEEAPGVQLKLSPPQPSHLQALADKEEEKLCSPSPVDSMEKGSKHGPKHCGGQTSAKHCGRQTSAMDKHGDTLVLRQLETLQPSQPQTGADEEENFRPMPAAKSIISCTKHVPKCPVGPKKPSDEFGSSQIVQSQALPKYGEPCQHTEGTSQIQHNSSEPQPSQPQAGTTGVRVGKKLSKERTRGRSRGRTQCLDVLNSTEKIHIEVNELGQAVGSKTSKLASFLGIIARDGNISPLNYLDWRALPDDNKERMWQNVLSNFDIDPKSKSWVLKSISKKWRDWKAELKSTRFNTHETDEERIADCDERVIPDQWRVLVSFWNSREAKEISDRNKEVRANQQTSHAMGHKSFAQLREEELLKSPDGKSPSRAEMYKLTRTRKDGHPLNAAASSIISKLHETAQQEVAPEGSGIESDVFTQVMGQDRHGYVRTFGLGPSPSDLSDPSHAEAAVMKMAAATTNAEVKEMKEKIMSLEQTCAQMTTQMATMMSMMSDMQKKLSDMDGVPAVAPSEVVDISVDSGAHPSATTQGVSPNQVNIINGDS